MIPKCPYCHRSTKIVSGKLLFPHRENTHQNMYFRCDPCDAHTWVNKGTFEPQGTVSNRELRNLKRRCHDKFTLTWNFIYKRRVRENEEFTEREAITELRKSLSKAMGMSFSETHFKNMNNAQARRALYLLQSGELT